MVSAVLLLHGLRYGITDRRHPAARRDMKITGSRQVRADNRKGTMSVGYKLYREVRDYAPQDWSASELVVAWVIADDANDDTRVSWIQLPLLCSYSRLAPSSVRAALAKMGAGGYEFRIVHGYGKDGRPMFATKGHAVDYLVPDMLKGASLLAPFPVDNPPRSRQDSSGYTGPKALGIEPKALGIGAKGAGIPAPLSSDLLSISSITNGPDLTGPVENTRETSGQKMISAATGEGGPAAQQRPGRHAAPEEIARWQAGQYRAERAATEHGQEAS